MRAQASIASLVTSLALFAEPVSAADKICGQTRSAYDGLINPRLSQTDVELWYKMPFSPCSSYGVEIGASLPRDIAADYRLLPNEKVAKTSISDLLEKTSDVQVYKQSGKDTYGLGVGHWGIGVRFEEKSSWVNTSFEVRMTARKVNAVVRFEFK